MKKHKRYPKYTKLILLKIQNIKKSTEKKKTICRNKKNIYKKHNTENANYRLYSKQKVHNTYYLK